MRFLSTLSLRRATFASPFSIFWTCHFYPRSPCGDRRRTETIATEVSNFYPRSPCGERRTCFCVVTTPEKISIHALLAESDIPASAPFYTPLTFLSTLSLRRATQKRQTLHRLQNISIHALLAESDLVIFRSSTGSAVFLSTLSLRRATLSMDSVV